MLTVKKQTAAFALLLLVALPLILSVGLFTKQKVLQYQREQRFKTELSQTVIVSSENICWIEEEKEILIDGRLFDVQSVKKVEGKLALTGFFDNKEDKMVQQIVKLALHKNQSGSPFSEPAIKFLFFPAYVIKQETNAELNWKNISQPYHQYDEAIPVPPCSSPAHPPC